MDVHPDREVSFGFTPNVESDFRPIQNSVPVNTVASTESSGQPLLPKTGNGEKCRRAVDRHDEVNYNALPPEPYVEAGKVMRDLPRQQQKVQMSQTAKDRLSEPAHSVMSLRTFNVMTRALFFMRSEDWRPSEPDPILPASHGSYARRRLRYGLRHMLSHPDVVTQELDHRHKRYHSTCKRCARANFKPHTCENNSVVQRNPDGTTSLVPDFSSYKDGNMCAHCLTVFLHEKPFKRHAMNCYANEKLIGNISPGPTRFREEVPLKLRKCAMEGCEFQHHINVIYTTHFILHYWAFRMSMPNLENRRIYLGPLRDWTYIHERDVLEPPIRIRRAMVSAVHVLRRNQPFMNWHIDYFYQRSYKPTGLETITGNRREIQMSIEDLEDVEGIPVMALINMPDSQIRDIKNGTFKPTQKQVHTALQWARNGGVPADKIDGSDELKRIREKRKVQAIGSSVKVTLGDRTRTPPGSSGFTPLLKKRKISDMTKSPSNKPDDECRRIVHLGRIAASPCEKPDMTKRFNSPSPKRTVTIRGKSQEITVTATELTMKSIPEVAEVAANGSVDVSSKAKNSSMQNDHQSVEPDKLNVNSDETMEGIEEAVGDKTTNSSSQTKRMSQSPQRDGSSNADHITSASSTSAESGMTSVEDAGVGAEAQAEINKVSQEIKINDVICATVEVEQITGRTTKMGDLAEDWEQPREKDGLEYGEYLELLNGPTDATVDDLDEAAEAKLLDETDSNASENEVGNKTGSTSSESSITTSSASASSSKTVVTNSTSPKLSNAVNEQKKEENNVKKSALPAEEPTTIENNSNEKRNPDGDVIMLDDETDSDQHKPKSSSSAATIISTDNAVIPIAKLPKIKKLPPRQTVTVNSIQFQSPLNKTTTLETQKYCTQTKHSRKDLPVSSSYRRNDKEGARGQGLNRRERSEHTKYSNHNDRSSRSRSRADREDRYSKSGYNGKDRYDQHYSRPMTSNRDHDYNGSRSSRMERNKTGRNDVSNKRSGPHRQDNKTGNPLTISPTPPEVTSQSKSRRGYKDDAPTEQMQHPEKFPNLFSHPPVKIGESRASDSLFSPGTESDVDHHRDVVEAEQRKSPQASSRRCKSLISRSIQTAAPSALQNTTIQFRDTRVILDGAHPGQTVVPWGIQNNNCDVMKRNSALTLRKRLAANTAPAYTGIMMNRELGVYVKTVCIYGELFVDNKAKQIIWSKNFHGELAYLPAGGVPPTSFDKSKIMIQLFRADKTKGYAGQLFIKNDISQEEMVLIRREAEHCTAAIGECK